MSVRPDMQPLAKSLGASQQDRVAVNIARDIYDEIARYAKRTHCKPETAVNAALAEWLGRV